MIQDVRGLRIEGLTIRPGPDGAASDALVAIRNGRDIILDRLDIASAANAENWTAKKWRTTSHDGIQLSGRDITVRNSVIRIVKHGISSRAAFVHIENNTIELFGGDGIRGLGDNSTYVGNTIDTCVGIDDNHNDGFQSWSTDASGRPGRGIVRNVLVENNVIQNGDSPLGCALQGIGLFDGIYEDWTIRGNSIIVNHWHGITVLGARRVEVLENTVVDAKIGKPGPPWIVIAAHKDGRPSENSIIAGNVSQFRAGDHNKHFSQSQPGVRLTGNRSAPTPEAALALRH